MSTAPRRWYRLRLRTLILLILLVTIGLSVYSYWSDYSERAIRLERELLSPARGNRCTVVFKRELLGLDRMEPAAASVDGVKNYASGSFVLMNDDWIVLGGEKPGNAQQWIPRGNVLLLYVDEE